MIDHKCFWTALVLALMNTCASCQTSAPKPLVSCEALESRIAELSQRVETLETQLAINHATPSEDDRPACIPEDRN